MKQTLALLIIISLSMSAQATKKDVEEARNHYAELASQSTNDIQWLTQPVDDKFIKEIEEGIAFSDEEINAALIQIVYMKSAIRFRYNPRKKNDPKELSEFKSIAGLQEFITAQLASEKPEQKVILTSAILYGSDIVISDRLHKLYTSKNDLATTVIKALWAGNLTDSKFKPIILQAIASDDADLACAAAQYLTNNPLPEALPALIKQYQRTNKDLDLKPVAVKPPCVQVDPYDVWRMLVGRAVCSYDRNALLEYGSQLKAIDQTVNFGMMSGETYNGILRKISNSEPVN